MRIYIHGTLSERIADCGPMTSKGRSMRTLRRMRIAEIRKKIKLQRLGFKSAFPARFPARKDLAGGAAGGRIPKSEIKTGFTPLEIKSKCFILTS